MHEHCGTQKTNTKFSQTHFTSKMNGKESALFPTNNNNNLADDDEAVNFNSIFSSNLLNLSTLLMPPPFPFFSSSPNPTPLFPARRRLEQTHPTPNPNPRPHKPHPPPTMPKTEPTGFFSRPPFPTTSPYHHLLTPNSPSPFRSSDSQKRPCTVKNAVVLTTSALARQRRARLSDKTLCLQKLIPLDRQMNTATLYHETYEYVKFLEAQISVLQSMPVAPDLPPPLLHTTTTTTTATIDPFGGLGRLNRQQTLQILMNSQVAQTVMYKNSWCAYSAEQLAALLQERDQQVVVEQRRI